MTESGWKKRAWHIQQWHGRSYALAHPLRTARFLFGSREVTNFTYDLSNAGELADFLAGFFGTPASTFTEYLQELEDDEELRADLAKALRSRSDRDPRPKYGRRAGWYAVIRHLRPRLVVETGTHDGLGSTVMARALQRNGKGGRDGILWTFDTDPKAGWLVPPGLRGHVEFVTGQIRETLPPRLAAYDASALGVFLHDSDHRYEHERFEYETARRHLSKDGVVMTDNAHYTTALKDVVAETGGRYARWVERPKGHPYPGGGLGLARWTQPTSESSPE